MTASQVLIWSICTAAAGVMLLGGALVWRAWRMQKAEEHLEEAVQDYAQARFVIGSVHNTSGISLATGNQVEAEDASAQPVSALRLAMTLPAWMQTGWAKTLLPEEERTLLDQAGISLQQGAVVYVTSRIVLAVLLPVLAMSVLNVHGLQAVIAAFLAFGTGLMLPKWMVKSQLSKRRKRLGEELPLFIDMLRLLQGVGLSVDQSLHILANEFSRVLRVLSPELLLANRLYATGRSREQSFQRLLAFSQDDDMGAVVNLLVQVDKHGGAVQEPLAQFSLRLREKRQASFKEKIGTITVKMTAVMVLTLLPALIVITAGPGFMAVMRSLTSMR